MLNIFMPGTAFPEEFPKGALVLVDKPIGWTSFDVVSKIRIGLSRRLNVKRVKIGHAGTLDPLATGLLLLCIGDYTKKIESFQDMGKEYTGVVSFGAVTASFDLEKPTENPQSVADLMDEHLQAARLDFIGAIQQAPPAFSAIKVDGKRVYKNARTGQLMEMEPRTVQVSTFDLSALRPVQSERREVQRLNDRGAPIYLHPDHESGLQADFLVRCGKGTYIRSLVHDLGEHLGTGAYLSSLRRTAIGEFRLENAWSIEQFADWAAEMK